MIGMSWFFSYKQPSVKIKATISEVDTSVKKETNRAGMYEIAGDSLIIPPFSVEIQLSPKASKHFVLKAKLIYGDDQ